MWWASLRSIKLQKSGTTEPFPPDSVPSAHLLVPLSEPFPRCTVPLHVRKEKRDVWSQVTEKSRAPTEQPSRCKKCNLLLLPLDWGCPWDPPCT